MLRVLELGPWRHRFKFPPYHESLLVTLDQYWGLVLRTHVHGEDLEHLGDLVHSCYFQLLELCNLLQFYLREINCSSWQLSAVACVYLSLCIARWASASRNLVQLFCFSRRGVCLRPNKETSSKDAKSNILTFLDVIHEHVCLG